MENKQIRNIAVKEAGKDLINSITTTNMDDSSLINDTQLLTYIKVIYDGLTDYETIDHKSQGILEKIVESGISVTKEMVIDVVKINLTEFEQADNDDEVISIFLAGLEGEIKKSSSSYSLAKELEDIVERKLDDIVDSAEEQVIQGEGIHGYLNLPFDGRLYLLQTFLENAEDNDINDLDMQIKYPLIVNALSIPNGKKKIEEILSDGFNKAYQDHEYDINPKTTLKIVNELLNK